MLSPIRRFAPLALAALVGCAGPETSVPQTSTVRYLVVAPPTAALDSVAAWAEGSDLLAADRTADGTLALRDRRAGQDNRAVVTARPSGDRVSEVTVASTYRTAPGYRDFGIMVYSGQVGEARRAFARPAEGSPSCFDLDAWFDRQTAPPDPAPAPPRDDDAPVEEVAPELMGGLPGLMERVAYPPAMRRAGMEGTVLVEFIVDETGAVSCAQAVSSPHPEFTASALEAVRASAFTPGTQGGVPVSVRFAVPITFGLR